MIENDFLQAEKIFVGLDGFQYTSVHPYAEGHHAIDAFLVSLPPESNWTRYHPQVAIASEALTQSEQERNAGLLCASVERAMWTRGHTWGHGDAYLRASHYAVAVEILMNRLAGQKINASEAEIQFLVEVVTADDGSWWLIGVVLDALEPYLARSGRLEAWREALETQRRLLARGFGGDFAELMLRIDQILEYLKPGSVAAGDAWADAVLDMLEVLEPSTRDTWNTLFAFMQTAAGARPTGKWLKEARQYIAAIGEDVFAAQACEWLRLAGDEPDSTNDPLIRRNYEFLKGLVWCSSLIEQADICPLLGRLAATSYTKLPGIGPRCPNVGNACIHALTTFSGKEAVGQLARLQQRVQYHQGQQLITKALETAAKKAGLMQEDMEELFALDFGLDANDRLCKTFGDFTVEAELVGIKLSGWRWAGADGKVQKTVPAAIKQGYAKEWKAFKQNADALETMLAMERGRLEQMFLSERTLSLVDWRARYLDQPLRRGMTRRLIWRFQTGENSVLGIWHDNRLVDAEGCPLEGLTDATTVRLWHPIESSPETVLQWRVWLETHGIVQPFKQGHREIYILTDAERNTHTYSNRFAAHILRQHQFAALCRQRGWKYHLMGQWDSHNIPARDLSRWNLSVEFWVEESNNTPISDSYVYLYISTDQVRFCDRLGTPRPLEEIPPLVFSEVMRDVDLFVGVASVGNDPTWHDQGELGGTGGYWHDYAFGELSATAQTRRDVLQRLLPRLKIASRSSLEGKFLKVRGDLRIYKIHLGSGNILMEPNDQYLCVVPDRSPKSDSERVFLPFEGDQTLAVILSKAFLLAEDTKITDPTITRQIKER